MNQIEQEFFIDLVSFENCNESRLRDNVNAAASPEVLGQLFFNRMQGVAYGRLAGVNLLKHVNREFRNCLRESYERNVIKNQSYYWCVEQLQDMLQGEENHYAMLKGAVLCGVYPKGYRCASDVDILVRNKDVTGIGLILLNNGFRQGKVINGEFIPAARREIIESKMMRGETVPYIYEVNLPELKYLEVDINYSLDYKNSDGYVVEKLLNNSTDINVAGIRIRTLSEIDFFIHLCAHLYKEATTYPWVCMKRDMSLYKYADIYMIICSRLLEADNINVVFERAKELGLDSELCFAVIQTAELFNLSDADYIIVSQAKKAVKGKEKLLHRVINPKEKMNYVYREKDIVKRFFDSNRVELLRKE